MAFRLVVGIFTLAIVTIVIVDGQGAGGGGGESGGGWDEPDDDACKTDGCKRPFTFLDKVCSTIFGIFLVWCLGLGLWEYLSKKPLVTNESFIETTTNDEVLETDIESIFRSGIWISRYYQYGRWHDPNRLSLGFDAREMKVNGEGWDDVGRYKITGIYSTKTQRLGLMKTYEPGTGDLKENLGHSVTIQLCWNSRNEQFEGKWYVQTSKYYGEDKFELKFSN